MAQAPSGKLDDWMRQGLSLHQAGRLAEAETLYRRVLDKQPSHPAANHLLGLVKLQQGDAESAVALISRAVHVRGGDPQYHCNLGVALNAAGQPRRAIASFDRALALQPAFAEAHSNRGMALKNLGRPAEAADAYRQAIALKPGEAGFHLNLGNALADLGDLHAAEVELSPGAGAAAGLSGGAVGPLPRPCEALGRAGEAVAAGEQAVAARPDEPEYHRSLGRAWRAAGRPEAAVASYRRAIELSPRDAESWRLMSLIVRRATHDRDMEAMERLLGEPGLPEEAQAQLHFALGKGCEDVGDYDRSFDHFIRGNALQRQRAPFSLPEAEQDFAALERLFDRDAPRAAEAEAVDAPPVFVVGLPRSGKSSLEGMLGRHPLLHTGGELPYLARLVADLWRRYDLASPSATLDDVPPSAFAELGAAYIDEVRKLAPPPMRVIDTLPPNFRYVGFIRLALPNAPILHCTRDPLEHCVALFQKYFALPGYEFASDLGDLAAYYRLYRRLMAHWHGLFPGAILDVDVARLRADPEAGMQPLLDFCGLDWDPACAAPYEPEPEVGQSGQPARELSRARLGPYRNRLGTL